MTIIYTDSSLTEACYVIEGEEPCFVPYLEPVTVNVGEYYALLTAIMAAHQRGFREVTFRSDSKLIVEQTLGHYAVRAEHLKSVSIAVAVWLIGKGWQIEWVPREENLAGIALEKRKKQSASLNRYAGVPVDASLSVARSRK